MKDPLNKEMTPYEILGIDQYASRDEIQKALKEVLKERKNVNKATQARNVLRDTYSRAFVDIFHYDDKYLNQIEPHLLNNPLLLNEERMQICDKWFNRQIADFPVTSTLTHCLAVLWYWWTISNEDEYISQINAGGHSANTSYPAQFNSNWENTIGYWVYILNSPDFLLNWINQRNEKQDKIYKNDVEKFSQDINSHFENIFNRYSEKYAVIDNESVKRFSEYKLLFYTEENAAFQLSKTGIKYPRDGVLVSISCGPLMLKKAGQLENVKKQAELMLAKYSTSSPSKRNNLEKVISLLSPNSQISILLSKNKYEEVINEIEKIPEKDRNIEINTLYSKALINRGCQLFSIESIDEALIVWGKAKNTGFMIKELEIEVVEICKKKAAAIQRSNEEGAINILEKAIDITGGNNELKKQLSILLLQRGIMKVNKAQGKLKQGTSITTVKKELNNGIADMKKAVALDKTNSMAKEQLQISQGILNSIDDFGNQETALKVNKEGVDLLNQAMKDLTAGKASSARNKLNSAISKFAEAKKLYPTNKVIAQNLDIAHKNLEDLNKIEREVGSQSKALNINKEGVDLLNEAINDFKYGNRQSGTTKLIQARMKFYDAYTLLPSNITIKANLDTADKLIKQVAEATIPKSNYNSPYNYGSPNVSYSGSGFWSTVGNILKILFWLFIFGSFLYGLIEWLFFSE